MARRRIGIVYDLLGTYPAGPDTAPDADAEFEPEETIVVLEQALRRLGHEPVRIGNPHELLARVAEDGLAGIDAALNIAEGHAGRNREAWAPVLLEMAGIRALGSDALTLSLSLDKAWAKDVLRAAGIPVPAHAVAASREAAQSLRLPAPFPLFVKPRWEGTAKGIRQSSRVEDRRALISEVARVVETYAQPALVEAFLPGPEYTVTVIGNDPPRALPVLQRALEKQSRIGIHALAGQGSFEHETPGVLEPGLEARLQELALASFVALSCRDFARVDFRLDAAGNPFFLEINPLPTFAPDGSFGILAELLGRELEDLLAEVLSLALHRVQCP
jgi:D-alanine-D-alanine ligase